MRDKDYKKYMKQLEKDSIFSISQEGRRNTVKVTHIPSGELYSVHPGDKAMKPLRAWVEKHKKQ